MIGILEVESLVRWLIDMLTRVTYSAPKKYRRGTLAYADGSTWNPGSGEGLYQYDGSKWWPLWSQWSLDSGKVTTSKPVAVKGITSPPGVSPGEVVSYVSGSRFVLAYNDGGTVRYKYLDMAGTGTTWTHTTTPP